MELILILIAPFIASLLSFYTATHVGMLGTIAIISTSITLLSTLRIATVLGTNLPFTLTPYFSIDHMGAILLVLLSFGGLMASIYARGYLANEMKKEIIGFSRAKKLYAQLHLFLLAMSLAIATASPILTWIAVEATTLTTAFLISFYYKPSAIEAAWKYLILNSVGLLFAFFGTLLFLTPELQSSTPQLATWKSLLLQSITYNPFIVKMAFLFVLVGYGTKVGLVPMHTWLPDAHSKAPSPISSLLSGVLLNIPLLAILRFKTITDAAVGAEFSSRLLIGFGIVSLVVSSMIILIQKNYKRLLAYSSIEHMGIMTLGFGLGGAASYAALLHMIYHSLTKSVLFLSAGNVFLRYSTTKIENVKGMITKLPITSIVFFLGVFTIIGMPPMGMFFTELSILSVSINRSIGITIVALTALILVGIGFIRHISHMMFGQPANDIQSGENVSWTTAPIILLAFIIIMISLTIPSSIQTFLHLAASRL